MIFKPFLCEKILTGEKTQTRRPQHEGDISLGVHYLAHVQPPVCYVYSASGKLRYEVGKTYAAQPGRTKKALCRFQLLGIRSEFAYDISREDAIAEGFGNWGVPEIGFWDTWTNFYDKEAQIHLMYVQALTDDKEQVVPLYREYLKTRPDHLYREWALNFEVVK